MNIIEEYELHVCETVHVMLEDLNNDQLQMLAMGFQNLMNSYVNTGSPVFTASYRAMQLCILEHNSRL